ncbi:MAG: hypothetical protein KGJ13_11740 [Patescibacteria group bacterium]|nr:hypothetical protein [Patescibacteria group bacterium]
MTASELKYQVEQAGHEPHFFDRATMRFFGDRMSNYGVRPAQIVSNYNAHGDYVPEGATMDVWELYRKQAVRHNLQGSAYFDRATFRRVFPKK